MGKNGAIVCGRAYYGSVDGVAEARPRVALNGESWLSRASVHCAEQNDSCESRIQMAPRSQSLYLNKCLNASALGRVEPG